MMAADVRSYINLIYVDTLNLYKGRFMLAAQKVMQLRSQSRYRIPCQTYIVEINSKLHHAKILMWYR